MQSSKRESVGRAQLILGMGLFKEGVLGWAWNQEALVPFPGYLVAEWPEHII